MSWFLHNMLLTSMGVTANSADGGKLYLRVGVDTTLKLTLANGHFSANSSRNYGGAGTHNGLKGLDVYFGYPACFYQIGGELPSAFSSIWKFTDGALELPEAFTKISYVNLLESGRSGCKVYDLSKSTASGTCYVSFNDTVLTIVDNAGSSALYVLEIGLSV